MLAEQVSLVKYSTPFLINSSAKPNKNSINKKEQDNNHTEDILGHILPPKQHRTDNGQIWLQTVLSTPATKNEVLQLSQQLNRKLIKKQARQVGLCSKREELYDQCFDEIIRQTTIDCRQRGLLLVHVRDQYRNQTQSYKQLYESSINHGMRRVIESDKKKQRMNTEISRLQNQCSQLERYVGDLQVRILQKRETEENRLRQRSQRHQLKKNEIKSGNLKIKNEIQVSLQKQK